MNISGVSGSTTPAAIEAQRTALVLKKQQDVAQDQAQALIALIKQASSSPDTGRLIDVRA
jgi:Putative motility protein